MQKEQYDIPKNPDTERREAAVRVGPSGEAEDDRMILLPHSPRILIVGQTFGHQQNSITVAPRPEVPYNLNSLVSSSGSHTRKSWSISHGIYSILEVFQK
ncbi:MAG TPA: hypothetical protein VN666_13165 [Nitrospira sp.]|nr:hypothetical protein [Nitrospira sp.]